MPTSGANRPRAATAAASASNSRTTTPLDNTTSTKPGQASSSPKASSSKSYARTKLDRLHHAAKNLRSNTSQETNAPNTPSSAYLQPTTTISTSSPNTTPTLHDLNESTSQSQPHRRRPSTAELRRISSLLHYTTFPNVRPPTSRGRPLTNLYSSNSTYNGGVGPGTLSRSSSARYQSRNRLTGPMPGPSPLIGPRGGRSRSNTVEGRVSVNTRSGSRSGCGSPMSVASHEHVPLLGNSSPKSHQNQQANHPSDSHTPLPVKQLAVLAVIALAEQTAFNSISPYLPRMASRFPSVTPGQEGFYVGLIASSFALAQFSTNFMWGWLSDRIGRKPVIIIGTVSSALCFLAFGFASTLWQALAVQIALGLFNGNQALVSTCLGELTDRSNQSEAFIWLPIVYGLGTITGPALGGLLVKAVGEPSTSQISTFESKYPFALPNIVAAILLAIDALLTIFFLEETLEDANNIPNVQERAKNLFIWLWQFIASSNRPTYLRGLMGNNSKSTHDDDDDIETSDDETNALPVTTATTFPSLDDSPFAGHEIFTKDTVLLLSSFLIFQLSNVAFASLYPIFCEANPPLGRGLSPKAIGLSMAYAGIIAIIFQIFFYSRLRDSLGNRKTFRISHILFLIAFVIMPFVGLPDKQGFGQGEKWVWIQLGTSLTLKTIAAVGGLTSALLMITNSAPDPQILGRLNGLAQTLAAFGRALGPLLSGGLFSLANKIKHSTPKAEALPFGLFAGIALLGFAISCGVRNEDLEAEDWEDRGSSYAGSDDCEWNNSACEREGRSMERREDMERRERRTFV